MALPYVFTDAGNPPILSAQVNANFNAVDLGLFNVKNVLYGAKGDGVTDDTAAFIAAYDAAVAAGGGIVYAPAATYIVNEVSTINPEDIPIFFLGDGIDLTVLKATTAVSAVIGLHCKGGVLNMTINGGATAQNGLAFGNYTANAVVDTMLLSNVRVTNIAPGSAGWLFVSICTPGTGYFINILTMENVVLDGPSATGQDAMGVAQVVACYAKNITIRNCNRSPNFYYIENLMLDGCYVTGGVSTTEPCFVVDSSVQRAVVANLNIDSSNASAPVFEAQDCTVTESYINTPTGLWFGQPSATLTGLSLRIISSVIAGAIVVQGSGDYGNLEVRSCRIRPQVTAPGAVLNYQATPTLPTLDFVGNYVDTTNVSGAVIMSNASGCNLSNAQITGNHIVGPKAGVMLGSTIGTLSNVLISDNLGYNPVGAMTAPTVGASPWTYTNSTGVNQTLNVSGGTVSAISANGVVTGLLAGSFLVPAGETLVVTYTAAPTVTASGN